MNYKKKRANYNSNPNYLDYLTALRKFFTNDEDIIPIIQEFNFYVNGVFSTPYVDLFRMYDDNLEDIHGAEKTKQLIDDGTIGIINNQIYNNGNGSLVTSLENLRVYMEDRSNKYTIAYNPFINAYAEALIPKINVLQTANPVVTNNDYNQKLAEIKKLYDEGDIGEGEYQKRLSKLNAKFLSSPEIQNPQQPQIIGGTKASLQPKTKTKIAKKNPLKMLFSKLNVLLNKKKIK